MANFTAFSVKDIEGNTYNGVQAGSDFNLEVPYGVDVSQLEIDYALSEANATVQVGGDDINVGDVLDFSSAITFDIINFDETVTEQSDITVNVLPNTEALIKGFSIPSLGVFGVIRDNVGTVVLIVPEGTDITNLVPGIELSDNATVDPPSGDAQDFTGGITYEVTAEDGISTKNYIVNLHLSPDHNNDSLTIYKMLQNRLPFLQDTEKNKQLASELTFEIMYELEPCFQVSVLEDESVDESRIGMEVYYPMPKKSVIADILAMQLVRTQALKVSGGFYDESNEFVEPTGTFIEEAEAGSVLVKYSQFEVDKSSVLATNTDKVYESYKTDVLRKLDRIGCLFEVGENGQLTPCESTCKPYIPFTVKTWGNG